MKKLLFKNFVFTDDPVQVTVRRGTKWSGYRGDVMMQTPSIGAITACNEPIPARVVYTKEVRFCDIKAADISIEHDPECRTYQGLLHAMERAYEGFSILETVTVVYFLITEVIEDETIPT